MQQQSAVCYRTQAVGKTDVLGFHHIFFQRGVVGRRSSSTDGGTRIFQENTGKRTVGMQQRFTRFDGRVSRFDACQLNGFVVYPIRMKIHSVQVYRNIRKGFA